MFNQRTNDLFQQAREILCSGKLGELKRSVWIITNWYRTQHYYDSGSWRATWAGEGGGVLLNQAPHNLDLWQWICGMPCEVTGFCDIAKYHNIEVEDDVTIFVRYPNGATGTFITSTGEAPGTNRLEISGTLGKLLCEGDKLYWTRNETDSALHSRTYPGGFTKPKRETVEVQTDGENPQHEGILNNFANALLGLEEMFVDGVEGIRGVELMNAMELSGWMGGEEITLPVDEERYLAELNKRRATSKLQSEVSAGVTDTAGTF
jgi:predicted dehydrogenase